jgi:uroporphyrinogen-III synthase
MKFSQAWRMTERSGLAGRRIVVTRPAQQAAALLEALRAVDAEPLFFPVIEIVPLTDVSPLHALADKLSDYDFAFFVSANAVEQTLAIIPRGSWPASLRIVTVGPGSARALQSHGFDNVMLPASQFDSEGVLDLPALQTQAVAGKRVLILRGNGGRELLAQGLIERGARVDVQTCYQRRRAHTSPTALLQRFAAGELDAISFTSSEGARNFADLLNEDSHATGDHARDAKPGSALLAALPCFVPHSRIEAHLRALGAQHIVLTGAGDAALIASLQHHFR